MKQSPSCQKMEHRNSLKIRNFCTDNEFQYVQTFSFTNMGDPSLIVLYVLDVGVSLFVQIFCSHIHFSRLVVAMVLQALSLKLYFSFSLRLWPLVGRLVELFCHTFLLVFEHLNHISLQSPMS